MHGNMNNKGLKRISPKQRRLFILINEMESAYHELESLCLANNSELIVLNKALWMEKFKRANSKALELRMLLFDLFHPELD